MNQEYRMSILINTFSLSILSITEICLNVIIYLIITKNTGSKKDNALNNVICFSFHLGIFFLIVPL